MLFPYELIEDSAMLIGASDLIDAFPKTWSYLQSTKAILEAREGGKFHDLEWYRFGRNQNLSLWEQSKLMIPYMVRHLSAYLDISDYLYFSNVTTGGYGITLVPGTGRYEYICGLLNSPVLNFFLKNFSTNFQGGYMAANKQYIERLPIRTIDFTDPADVARHERMVALVEHMLDLHKRLAVATVPHVKDHLQGQIEVTDGQIDALVYELYELTDEEIAIVEASAER